MSLTLSDRLRDVAGNLENEVAYFLRRHDMTHAGEIDHLDLRDDGMMTFRPVGRPHVVNPDGTWSTAGRMAAKPGRVIRRAITIKLDDYQVERWATDVAAWAQAERCPVRIVRRHEIAWWYDEARYHPSTSLGNLAVSCMRHRECRDYLGLYVRNPTVCGMAIITTADDDGIDKLVGRALLWETDNGPYLDRIYGSDVTRARLIIEARRNGWDTYPNPPGGVPLTVWRFDAYPFMDTYNHIDLDVGYLIAPADADDDDESWTHTLESQHGDISGRNWTCPSCHRWARNRPVDGRCEACAGASLCDLCNEWCDDDENPLTVAPPDAPLIDDYPGRYCAACVETIATRVRCPHCGAVTTTDARLRDDNGDLRCGRCRYRAPCVSCLYWTNQRDLHDGRCRSCQPIVVCHRCANSVRAGDIRGDRCTSCEHAVQCPCGHWPYETDQWCFRCGQTMTGRGEDFEDFTEDTTEEGVPIES